MDRQNLSKWNCVLELDNTRSITNGNESSLRDAIRSGADLRIYTEFRHNEHIDTTSSNPEIVREVAEFRTTYLIDNRWVSGIMTLRQPVELPRGFGHPPSMSFFMYNEDGTQSIARPYLGNYSSDDLIPPSSNANRNVSHSISSDTNPDRVMGKYHLEDEWDTTTNAPSHNFVYDFDVYRYWVCDNWEEILSHEMNGNVKFGSVDDLVNAFSNGCEVKIGIRNLCSDLSENQTNQVEHEVFVQLNSCYYYTQKKLFIGASHPLVRVGPSIPMRYKTDVWDFGWIIAKSDGYVALRLVNPYTLKFHDTENRYAVRWFVR